MKHVSKTKNQKINIFNGTEAKLVRFKNERAHSDARSPFLTKAKLTKNRLRKMTKFEY